MLIEYRLRIRNAANSADALVITSVVGGTNPYLAEGAPVGDGETIDPRTGETTFGSYSGEMLDPLISGDQRLVTSILEDADGRAQLGYRVSILESRIDGGVVLTAGAFVVGHWYTIKTIGTTDFTLIGAASNTVGLTFKATGVGTGTGTAEEWDVLINGLLTLLQRTPRGTYKYSVGDPLHALTTTTLFSPASDVLITDFLDDWPARGCILGGPIRNPGATADAMHIADLGGWTMRVKNSGPGIGANQYGLQVDNVYGPPTWQGVGRRALADLQDAINEAASTLQMEPSNGAASPWDTIGDVYANGWAWRGLIVLINDVPWKPLTVFDDDAPVAGQRHLLVTGHAPPGGFAMKVISDGVKTLTDNTLVRVRVISVLPTEVSPLYLSGHPVDLLTRFFTAADIPYSSSACDDLKDLIGHAASMTLRITSARQLSDLVRTVCLRDGIGLRVNDDGEIDPFDARLGRSPDDPVLEITDDDVEDGSVQAYELDPGQAIKQVTFQSKFFADQKSVPVRRSDQTLVDGVAVIDEEIPFVDADPGALPHGELTISIDAMVHLSRDKAGTVRGFFEPIARRIFDRWGRGGIGAEMTLLRGRVGDSLQLGDEVLVNLPQVPNHNYLLGDHPATAARAMQIVRRTVRAIGYDVKLVDSGASRQPPSTVATASVAASSDLPRSVAEATIDNAATINGAGYGARLQIAFTDDGSDAGDEQFTDVMAWAPGLVPTGAVRLPPVESGLTVQVRARSELPGARPTNWSALDKVTLDAIDPVSGLSATPDAGDGSKCLLEWTPGSATDLADIWIRLDGESFDQAARVATLEAGSIQHELADLEPSTDYIASVVMRDPVSNDASAPVDASFTTSATSVTLDPPTDPAPFSGRISVPRFGRSTSSILGGIYGIGVLAADVPGEIEISEAIETAVGAGTYGSYETVGRIDTVSGQWTIWQSIAPNDGLTRRLRARHVRDGATPSSYTSAVIATPWIYQALPAYPGDALLELLVTPLSPTASDRFAFQLQPRDPLPTGQTDLELDFSAESGLVLYEYNTTTPAAPVSVASGDTKNFEAIKSVAGDGPKSVSWTVEKSGRRTGLSGPIVVPEQISPSSALPIVDTIGASASTTPCDGGGSFTLILSTLNAPPGATYNLVWTNIGGGTYDGATGSVSGVVNGSLIGDGGLGAAVPLCPGDSLRVVVSMIVDGVTVAVGVNEFSV